MESVYAKVNNCPDRPSDFSENAKMSQAEIAAKSPCAVDVEKGKDYWWCSCGRSASQPFCNGAHKGSDFTPMKFTASESKTVYLCACKQTKNAPFCDGSHKSL